MTTAMYAIESEAPPARKLGRPPKYPFALLKKGQCFKVPKGNINSLRASAGLFSKKLGRTFAIRTLDNGVIGVYRTK